MLKKRSKRNRKNLNAGLPMVLIGFLIFLLGAQPGLFGLDRSPVIGFVQIAVFLVGLALICLGGYINFSQQWIDVEKSIAADIGLRFVGTGYVIAAMAGMADVFGFGAQPWPQVPIFSTLQAIGVIIGEAIIALGFLLMFPPPKFLDRKKSAE
ncbi:MAG: hypothetical protein IMY76_01155 [Chloroflexi bacterium]|nr:hypothetical protein [Chloroflexota bacterium]